MRDGTVEAVIRGDDEQHRKIAAALAEGPRWSKVRAVECVEEPNAVVDAGFEIAADGY